MSPELEITATAPPDVPTVREVEGFNPFAVMTSGTVPPQEGRYRAPAGGTHPWRCAPARGTGQAEVGPANLLDPNSAATAQQELFTARCAVTCVLGLAATNCATATAAAAARL